MVFLRLLRPAGRAVWNRVSPPAGLSGRSGVCDPACAPSRSGRRGWAADGRATVVVPEAAGVAAASVRRRVIADLNEGPPRATYTLTTAAAGVSGSTGFGDPRPPGLRRGDGPPGSHLFHSGR